MEENKLIYLSKDKNIICVNGLYIDLSTVSYINDEDDVLTLLMLNGREVYLYKLEYHFLPDFTGVPEKLQKNFTQKEINNIIGMKTPMGTNSVLDELGVTPSDQNGRYNFYNLKIKALQKLEHDNQWVQLKFKIIDKWVGIPNNSHSGFKITNKLLIELMTDYFKLNKGRENIVSDLEKVFGYSSQEIMECIDYGDFYIDTEGKIIANNLN